MIESSPEGILESHTTNNTPRDRKYKCKVQTLKMLENLGEQMGIKMTKVSSIKKEIKEQHDLDCHLQHESEKFHFAATSENNDRMDKNMRT